jgi:hypothetical protein
MYIVIIIGVAIAITATVSISDMNSKKSTNVVYLARLADPSVYNNDGLFTESFFIHAGSYHLRFVPSGDSPRMLSITISNDKEILFVEDFRLESTEQGNESARYFTWDYTGMNELEILEDQMINIEIDPHGNIIGPVTVEIIFAI